MSDKDKQQRYLAISKQITEQIGGKDNIVASTHCATRLRIVLKDYDKINKVRGMDIVIVTTANTNEEAKALLEEMGMPFKK